MSSCEQYPLLRVALVPSVHQQCAGMAAMQRLDAGYGVECRHLAWIIMQTVQTHVLRCYSEVDKGQQRAERVLVWVERVRAGVGADLTNSPLWTPSAAAETSTG